MRQEKFNSEQVHPLKRLLQDIHSKLKTLSSEKTQDSAGNELLFNIVMHEYQHQDNLQLRKALEAILDLKSKIKYNVVKEIQRLYNCDRNMAINILAKLLKVHQEYYLLANRILSEAEALAVENIDEHCSYIPSRIIMSNEAFYRSFIEQQHAFSDKVEQLVVQYSNIAGKSFFLLATCVQKNEKLTFTFGGRSGAAWLFSRKAINKLTDDGSVILPMTTELAIELKRLAKEIRLDNNRIILSGFFDGRNSFENLNIDVLRDKNVILIPEFSREGYFKCVEFARRIEKMGCTVKIYAYPIFTNPIEYEKALDSVGSPWKATQAKEGTKLYELKIFSNVLRRIMTTCDSVENFERLLRNLGLVETIAEPESELAQKFKGRRISEMHRGNKKNRSSKVQITDIIRHGSVTFVWGPTHSGKTYFGYSLACAIATGTAVFCFAAGAIPLKIFYLDGENSEEQAFEILEKVSVSIPNKDVLDDNFTFLEMRSLGISLQDEASQDEFIASLVAGGYQVLFIDNLISLFSASTKGDNADKFLDFVAKIEAHGIAVCYVNHANKGNKDFKGSNNMSSLSKTVFHIEGNTQIAEDEEKSPEVQSALDANVQLMRLNCKKCKAPQELTDEQGTYQLTPNDGWVYTEGTDFIDRLHNPIAQDVDDIIPVGEPELTELADALPENDAFATKLNELEATTNSSLMENARRVLACFDDSQALSRADVEARTGMKKSTANVALKFLVAKELLTPTGSGQNIRYILTTATV